MVDAGTDFVSNLFNGTTMGLPNILFLALLVGGFVAMYMLLSKKPKVKEYKPLIMKKEEKRRFNKQYKYFGKSFNKPIYDADDNEKPIAFVIGYMKWVEMKHLKRLEPLFTGISKEKLDEKHDKTAKEIYSKPYAELNEVEKKNIDEVSKEELRNEKIEVMDHNEKIRIVRGKKEIQYSEPIAGFAFKVCPIGFMNILLARIIGYGVDWFRLDNNQIRFEDNGIHITGTFQRRTPYDIFIFSEAGKKTIQDIDYEIERENIWQETANQIPRAVHFDTEASKQLIFRREDAKIDREKRKSQTETRDM